MLGNHAEARSMKGRTGRPQPATSQEASVVQSCPGWPKGRRVSRSPGQELVVAPSRT